jgi:K+-sensing histidine kinase KdpD
MFNKIIHKVVDFMEKILACITVQHNSRRLIQKAAELAAMTQGELHILYIEKGKTVFSNESTMNLLEELFAYGSRLNGQMHMVCDNNVPKRMVQFIEEMDISQVVLGESMKNKIQRFIQTDIEDYVTSTALGVDVMVVNREPQPQRPSAKTFQPIHAFSS